MRQSVGLAVSTIRLDSVLRNIAAVLGAAEGLRRRRSNRMCFERSAGCYALTGLFGRPAGTIVGNTRKPSSIAIGSPNAGGADGVRKTWFLRSRESAMPV